MAHLIYVVLRALVRVALMVYFSRIEVEGEEEVPSGPIVIAATHPNAFIDVALVATRLQRRVRFVAKAALFKNPLARLFLSTLGAVPVERKLERQGANLEAAAQDKNAQSLAACEEAVAEGGAVLIFPEGTSEIVPKLLPLKTGVARIALGAAARRATPDVHVVPVAVRYDDPTSFRSRARVSFLPPIPVAPFREMEAKDPQGAVRSLTGAVRDALEPSVVHVEDEKLAVVVKEVDALYGRHLAAAQGGAARLAAAPAIAQAVNAFAKSSPERIAKVQEKLVSYRTALEKAGLDDAALRPSTKASLGQDVALVLGAPITLWGIVHHYLPYQLPRIIASVLTKDATFISTIKLVSGTMIFIALYVAEGFAAERYLGPLWGTLWAVSLPVSGIIALEEIEAIKARLRRRHRKAQRLRAGAETIQELERLRNDVVSELDRARAEFLVQRAEQPADGLA